MTIEVANVPSQRPSRI